MLIWLHWMKIFWWKLWILSEEEFVFVILSLCWFSVLKVISIIISQVYWFYYNLHPFLDFRYLLVASSDLIYVTNYLCVQYIGIFDTSVYGTCGLHFSDGIVWSTIVCLVAIILKSLCWINMSYSKIRALFHSI